jgi:hypothetical protein
MIHRHLPGGEAGRDLAQRAKKSLSQPKGVEEFASLTPFGIAVGKAAS